MGSLNKQVCRTVEHLPKNKHTQADKIQCSKVNMIHDVHIAAVGQISDIGVNSMDDRS